MQTDYLRYLVKIIECGSMNKAANDLYITQSALTKAMKRMEADLNCDLLERTKSGIHLTVAGRQVYEDAKTILALEDGWQNLAKASSALRGKVRIAVINSVSSSALNRFLFDCRSAYPEIDLVLKEYRSYDFLRQFESRHADIGICNYFDRDKPLLYRFAAERYLSVEELYADQFYIFMSAHHAMAKKECLTLDDLKRLKFVMYSDENDAIAAPMLSQYFQPKNVFLMNNMNNMVRAAIEDDMTFINTKTFAIQNEYVAHGMIVYKTIENLAIPTMYYLLRPDDNHINRAERVVVELLKKNILSIFQDDLD